MARESLLTQSQKGFLLHAFTASGAIAGLLALGAVMSGHIRAGLIWLIVCQLIDGFDGPLARRIDISTHAPQINGHILDLVVDYVTCVVVPVALLVELNMLPKGQELWFAALIIFTGALWFARTDQETDDHWFNGFPAAWNIVVPTLLILDSNIPAHRARYQISSSHIVDCFYLLHFTDVALRSISGWAKLGEANPDHRAGVHRGAIYLEDLVLQKRLRPVNEQAI